VKEKWEELLVVLNKILNIYKAMLTLSQQKKELLVAAKSHELERVTKQEEVLILQVKKLERLREQFVNQIMTAYGIAEGNLSLAALKKIAKPDVVEQLELFGKEFDNIAAEIVPLNKLNNELIGQALGFINYNINILSQTVVGPTYAAKGQTNEQSKRRGFDAKV
jgi:flagellar biosynthesis/type III secretory pathway chaperone